MPTHFQGTKQEVQALDTFIKLTRAGNAIESRIFSRVSLGDLTSSQFGVLETLLHLGPLCQGTLSQKLLKSTGNMTMVIDNLEKRGLVRRVRSIEDRRMISIELTDAGRDLINQVFPRVVEAIVQEMSTLTSEEQIELGHMLRKLGKGKRAEVPLNEVTGSAAG